MGLNAWADKLDFGPGKAKRSEKRKQIAAEWAANNARMTAANAKLKDGLADTKATWDAKRADLAVERADIKADMVANKETMTEATSDLKASLADTKTAWDAKRADIKADMGANKETVIEDTPAPEPEPVAEAKTSWLDRANTKAAADKAAKGESFEGVKLALGRVTYKGQGGSVAGVTARVESSADVRRRITATRALTVGVFALVAKKQVGHIFLTVEAPGFEFVAEVPVKKEAKAREFAAKINNAAKAGA